MTAHFDEIGLPIPTSFLALSREMTTPILVPILQHDHPNMNKRPVTMCSIIVYRQTSIIASITHCQDSQPTIKKEIFPFDTSARDKT